MFKLVRQRPKLWQSHVVLLVLVLLVLAWGFCGVDWFLLDNGAVGLCWVADVVATFVHVVRTFIPVPVFVHGIKKDENTQRRCSYNANHHPSCAAGLPEDLWRSRGTLRSGGIGCKGDRDMITTNGLSLPSSPLYHYYYIYRSEWMHFFSASMDQYYT